MRGFCFYFEEFVYFAICCGGRGNYRQEEKHKGAAGSKRYLLKENNGENITHWSENLGFLTMNCFLNIFECPPQLTKNSLVM